MKDLIVSDIHGNLSALEAVLERESDWDELLCLGDLAVAGPFPDEVATLLFDLGALCVMGNHDREIVELDPDAPAVEPHRQWIRWVRREMSPRNLRFLADFPETCVVRHCGTEMGLTHGVLPKAWGGRLWPDSAPAVFAGLAAQVPEPVILFGHSHVQFSMTRGGTTFINPGAVGAPYLGQSLACYAVLEDGVADLRAVRYDVERTCRAMDRVPLEDRQFVEAWKDCWRTGTLPSFYTIRDYTALREMGYR